MGTTDLRQHERGDRTQILAEVKRFTTDYAQRIDNITNSLGNTGNVPPEQVNELHDIANQLRDLGGREELKLDAQPMTKGGPLAPPFQRNTQAPLVPERTVVQDDHGTRHDHQNGITTYDDGTIATDAAVGNGHPGPQGSQSGAR